jgi:hypothetical protein
MAPDARPEFNLVAWLGPSASNTDRGNDRNTRGQKIWEKHMIALA